ncbi:hypothetical protein [Burkholderia sp. 9120]|jgi:hypothetical protein|uniref:hypothetical protein n=1 Tax=Burkholderia sp. 9120 TaxID=1500897 RepID=UPI0012E06A0D|nr:hypothetical protein [Burkholderia sp. 9120]
MEPENASENVLDERNMRAFFEELERLRHQLVAQQKADEKAAEEHGLHSPKMWR